jgi:hypothetical protein
MTPVAFPDGYGFAKARESWSKRSSGFVETAK